MPRSRSRVWFALASVALALCAGAQVAAPQAGSGSSLTPSDEAALRALVERYFAAYAKKDPDAFMALWSDRSPDFAARREAIQQRFASLEKIEVRSLAVRRLVAEDSGVPGSPGASVRVVVDISALAAKTGKPAPGFGKLNCTLHCVRLAGG